MAAFSDAVVAQHYNSAKNMNIRERSQSRIVYLRNFHNWTKSCLISDYLARVRSDNGLKDIRVLDFCCGKGGDLMKWGKGGVSHVSGVDIAENAVEIARQRYDEKKGRGFRFTADFHVADLTRDVLRDRLNQSLYQLVSCQFSLHYSFESLEQADRMMANAAESLAPGGYFIGTTLCGNELIRRMRSGKGLDNDVFSIEFEALKKEEIPLFGCKYDFKLDGVVNCPEFVVHFPTLERLANRHGLKLVRRQGFAELANENIARDDLWQLANRMEALEPWPPGDGVSMMGTRSTDYAHAKPDTRGTLSSAEWEVTTLYLAFAFVKPLTSGELPNSALERLEENIVSRKRAGVSVGDVSWNAASHASKLKQQKLESNADVGLRSVEASASSTEVAGDATSQSISDGTKSELTSDVSQSGASKVKHQKLEGNTHNSSPNVEASTSSTEVAGDASSQNIDRGVKPELPVDDDKCAQQGSTTER